MNPLHRSLARSVLAVADPFLALLVFPAAWLLKLVRRIGVRWLPCCRHMLLRVGVFPLRDHYYEPRFDFRRMAPDPDRRLPGIDWNAAGQLAFLDRLVHADELAVPPDGSGPLPAFSPANKNFPAGDAGYWYQLIRAVRPRRIIEIGSGQSTLVAIRAVAANRAEDAGHACRHVCVEPYEMPWLEGTGVEVVRRRVETLDPDFFAGLGANDILFIDSSHVIRPQGDVLFEYLQLLPALAPGVIVHVHDIFSPRDYPDDWLREDVRLWNEQYLLEAFLTHNREWEILGALNWLNREHHLRLKRVSPHLAPDDEPGSFYLRKLPPAGDRSGLPPADGEPRDRRLPL